MIVIESTVLRIRNYAKLILVEEDLLRIIFSWTVLTIKGSQLRITQYDKDEIVLEGQWLNLQFESVLNHA